MPNYFKNLMVSMLFGRDRNIITLQDPYLVMMQLLDKQDVTGIIDAGASNGRISRKFLKLFPNARVYAFEPNPIYRDELDRLSHTNTRFFHSNLVLANESGKKSLNITRSPGCSSLFKPATLMRKEYPEDANLALELEVEAVTIDQWAAGTGDIEIQLMKFDIQGGELNALQGAARMLATCTALVYTEILFNELYEDGAIFSDVDRFLRSHGFVLYNLYKPKSNRDNLLMWGNSIFVHRDRCRM